MGAADLSAEDLRNQIAATEQHLQTLKDQLAGLEPSDKADVQPPQPREYEEQPHEPRGEETTQWPLTQEEYNRYGRQMIVSSIGIKGQLRLRAASVLIVGAGGLGCPAAVYIAGAGVKTLGLVDGDTVELSNLHRQILHNRNTIDEWKVDSAIKYLKTFNPNVYYTPYRTHLTPQNALPILSAYDLVLDCTDHPRARYLISDACILLCKPLISAAALQTDGQQLNLNYPPRPAGDPTGGPCYRCVFPKPPPPEQLLSCADGGIVGPVVGAMGVLQALEAIKLIVAGLSVADTTRSEFDLGDGTGGGGEVQSPPPPPPSMTIFASSSASPFRYVRLRSRRPDCFACSAGAQLTREALTSGSLDYVAFCGELTPVRLLAPEERVSAKEYARLREAGKKEHVLVDVREKVQFDICSIPGSINLPFSKFQSGPAAMTGYGEELRPDWLPPDVSDSASIYVVCRLGNDSQVVAKRLKEAGLDRNGKRYIGDIQGGLKAWRTQVDSIWPDY